MIKLGGMSDRELEAACIRDPSEIRHYFNWTSELYSFGKCLRLIARYPKILPLFIYSDHGAGLHSHFYPHELNNECNVHFTWHPSKANRYARLGSKRIVRITHPWVTYRKLRGIRRVDRPSGTLVFFTHHVPGIEWQGRDQDEYFEQLRALPEQFHPIVLCLHMHDINAGHHLALRRHGFPMVTAGNTSSADFVDKFYGLVSQFAYATSQDWGSQVAYCVEMGVPYFFLGPLPRLINISHKEMRVGPVDDYQDDDHKKYLSQARALFRYPDTELTPEKQRFVEAILGMDSGVAREAISQLVWREFFRNWAKWYFIPYALLVGGARILIGKANALTALLKGGIRRYFGMTTKT